MSVTIRPIEEADLKRLLATSDDRTRLHHAERAAMQGRGEATYLVAWRAEAPCGRATLFHRSKYEEVRERLGDFPEVNALEATPQGEGIGSQIIAAAEERARSLGFDLIGLAVEHDNVLARRLYDRLGYVDWGGGELVDRWVERATGGSVVREHADPCAYLLKTLS